MTKALTILFGIVLVCGLTTNAHAITITALTGNVTLGGGTGTGTGTIGDPIMIYESITGGGTIHLGITNIGTGNPATGHVWGRWFRKVVTNDTETAWRSFEHELHEILGVPSSEGDGLSFAQGYTPRPFSSDVFASWEEEYAAKDYVNFYNGSVAPGETVTFNYIITDSSPQSFYLVQNPNYPIIPEPATMSLLGIGLLGLAGIKRRKNS